MPEEHIRTPDEYISTQHSSTPDDHISTADEHISTSHKPMTKVQDATKGVETQSCLSERKRRKTDGEDKENPGYRVDPLI